MFIFRKTLWDVPPQGYEDITPVKYKALRGMSVIISNPSLAWKRTVLFAALLASVFNDSLSNGGLQDGFMSKSLPEVLKEKQP